MQLNPLSVEQMVLSPPPPMRPLVENGILYEGTKLIIYGEPKTYKSFLALYLAFSLATGTPWLNYPTTPCQVLYVQGEIAKRAFYDRVMGMYQTKYRFILPASSLFFESAFGLKLDRAQMQNSLKSAVSHTLTTKSRPKVLIIDPLYKFMSSRSEDSIQITTDLMDEFITLGLSIVIVAHSRKPKTDYRGQLIDLGGSELAGPLLEAWADGLIRITGDINTDYRHLRYELRHARKQIEPHNILFDRPTTLFQLAP